MDIDMKIKTSENIDKLSPTDDNFDEQIDSLHIIESADGSFIEFADLKPEILESDVPIVLLGGMATDIRSVKKAARTIFNQGRRVIIINQPLRSKDANDKTVHNDIHPYHSTNADHMLEVIKELDTEKVDVIAQSEASLYATVAALQQPDKIRNLVIFTGSGLIGKDSYRKLLARFIIEAAKPRKDITQTINYTASFMDYVSQKSYKELKDELKATASSRIDRPLRDLRDKGVKVIVIQAKSDPVYAHHRIERHVNVEDNNSHVAKNADVYTSLSDRDATHGTLLFDDSSTRSAVDIIRNLENSSLEK